MNKSHNKTLRKAQKLLYDRHTSEWDEITAALGRMDLDDPSDLAIRGRCRLQARRFDGSITDLEASSSKSDPATGYLYNICATNSD